MRDGRFLDTPDWRVDGYRYYSTSSFDRHHDHHHYHPHTTNDRGYLPNEFKKVKQPNFHGDMKKMVDVEA